MIQFSNCNFDFENKPLIADFNLQVEVGNKIVLYGPSGSGKSTILHAILGFVKPESGEITINGDVLNSHSLNQIRSLTAWVPQDISLPYNTVEEMVYAPFEFHNNRANRPSHAEILSLFDSLMLEHDLLDKAITEISGGQKQRIMLAIGILLKKPIILLDEPTSALDPQSVDAVITLLKTLTDTTMIAVSHDAKFIDAFDRKILIPKL